MSLSITRAGQPLLFKTWSFPDQSRGFRFESVPSPFCQVGMVIVARIQSSDDLVDLIMAVDAARERNEPIERLVFPCVPNQRQDRACVSGEPVGILAFARQIAALGIKHITMFDPHSEVTPAVFKALGMSVVVHSQSTIIGRFDALNEALVDAASRAVFVSPDSGANKKAAELATIYGHSYFVRADKLRDLATGKLKECVVFNPPEQVEGMDCVVADDLGDKCGTFIPLAKALKAKGARTVELYITHGLFTAPLDAILGPLFEAGITRVWCTNSYRTDLNDPRLTVLNLEEVFSL